MDDNEAMGGTEVRLGAIAIGLLALGGCYDGANGNQGSGDAASGSDTDAPDSGANSSSGADTEAGGETENDTDDPGPMSQCGEAAPGASPIRRLTGWEYDNTIRELLGDDSRPSVTAGFPQEGGSGFDNNADVSTVTWLMANKYMLASEDVSARAVTDLVGLMGCDPAADESGCIDGWLEEFGRDAWRRPLTAEEAADMRALYDDARSLAEVPTAVETVLQAFLQSPNFIYRVEFGAGDQVSDEAVPLDDWEMATRLSYFLWGSMPDDALFAAAEAGELRTSAQVEEQARRMIEDPRARDVTKHFFEQFLGYEKLSVVDKDPELFPEWSVELSLRQKDETDAFVEHVVFDDDATLQTLLTADYTFVDADLASFYDIQTDEAGADLVQVTPQGREVAGILSQGGILSVYSKPNQTNPIARGIFVREHLLCQIPPPPPDDVDIVPPIPDPDATTRELFDQHRANPACAGCHILFDPVGFGFENFDALGRWRDTENGFDVDASGELAATDVDGPFVGVAELGEALAGSELVADCVTRQWFRFAYGRLESEENDACNVEYLNTQFAESGYDLKELMVTLTQSDAFMFRTAYATEGGE